MPVKDCKTEQLIKDTAKRIFLGEGKMFATMQNIADAAGVNRTLLHYYFRSRDVLFNLVFTEALTKLREDIHAVLGSALPFKEKIENLMNVFYDELIQSPYLETFIAIQLNQAPEKYEELFLPIAGGKERLRKFLKEIQQEMEKGSIPDMKPVNFFINFFALIVYPFVARPIYMKMFELTEAGYTKLLSERKKNIMATVFKR